MGECDLCDGGDFMSHTCNECGGTFCSEHRLPEAHDCEVLRSTARDGRLKDDVSARKNRQSVKKNRPNDSGDETGKIRTNRTDTKKPDFDNITNEASRTTATSSASKISSALFFPIGLAYHAARRLLRLLTAPVRNPALGVVLLLIAAGGLATTGHLDGVFEAGDNPDDQSDNRGVVTQTDTGQFGGQTNDLDEARVEALVHERINEVRQERGLPRLEHDQELRAIASEYSKRMATEGFYGHADPSGDRFEDRYRRAGYSCNRRINESYTTDGGENLLETYALTDVNLPEGTEYVGTEQELADAIVSSWMHSDGHREILLKSYWKNEGIGVYLVESSNYDGMTVYATQNFC